MRGGCAGRGDGMANLGRVGGGWEDVLTVRSADHPDKARPLRTNRRSVAHTPLRTPIHCATPEGPSRDAGETNRTRTAPTGAAPSGGGGELRDQPRRAYTLPTGGWRPFRGAGNCASNHDAPAVNRRQPRGERFRERGGSGASPAFTERG
ncbi:hypothetical protein GCM10018987_46980 [Streptomyces cremeus]